MTSLTHLAFWPWLLLAGLLASIGGVALAYFFPQLSRLKPDYQFHPLSGIGGGLVLSAVAGGLSHNLSHNLYIVLPVGLVCGYLATWLAPDKHPAQPPPPPEQSGPAPAEPVTRVPLQHGWDRRPRYETQENGRFVGREELLERLTGDFTTRSNGTILISGVRGVGKTALVERALLQARDKLQNRYWQLLLPQLAAASWWTFDAFLRRVLFRNASLGLWPFSGNFVSYLAVRSRAEDLTKSSGEWSKRLNPVVQHICRLHEASRSQLLVLKFNASDISGALADPQPAPDPQNPSGKPQVNPEKLLRALIRKLYSTCHPSQPTSEARVLQWSLRDKHQRQEFFGRLAAAYEKSVSKSYKETISNSLKEALKESQSTTYEQKFNIERIAGLVICLAFLGGAVWAGLSPRLELTMLQKYIAGGAAVVASFLTLTWTSKRSREKTRDSDRQSQFSYEFDYSLAQMETDLKVILDTLSVSPDDPLDRCRCFTRIVMVFDELDKLENPVEQLNNVITHFKNFFTLSDALFVFITDHQFYEQLALETAKAQKLRQYSTEHTFFTNRIYLRKPEFAHFYETVYRCCEQRMLIESMLAPGGVRLPSADPDLVDYLLHQDPGLLDKFGKAPLATLTHLMLNLTRFPVINQPVIEDMFLKAGGHSDPFSLATLWAGLVGSERETKFRDEFLSARGWNYPESVALLYHHKSRFSESDQEDITEHYARNSPSLRKYLSVEDGPFTLSDIARALCFQSRNHYFDLFYLIHDYVGSYEGGVPVLYLNDTRFGREQRLWSRYQQMVEAAFRYRREEHPSREYWNAQLMETLYAVFDTRLNNRPVPIGALAYSPPKAPTEPASPAASASLSPPADPAVPAAAPAEGPVSAVTPRDVEFINEAVLRLLRLLVARGAVSVNLSPSRRDSLLRSDAVGLLQFADAEITWLPDCESEITQEGIGIEAYEQEVIDFWDCNNIDLESIDWELDKLWTRAVRPSTGPANKLKTAIMRLRSTAEGLRNRSTTISRPDANALLANFARLNAFTARVPDLFLERLQADGDLEILSAANRKDAPADGSFRVALASHSSEVDEVAKLPLHTIVFLKPGSSLVYLLAGPNSAADSKPLDQLLQQQSDSRLLWYDAGPEPSEPVPLIPNVTLYYPTRAAQFLGDMFAEYGRLASYVRLNALAASARGSQFKDLAANLRVGAELVKWSDDPADIVTAFSHPAVGVAAAIVQELVFDLDSKGIDDLISPKYGFQSGSTFTAEAFIDGFVRTVDSRLSGRKPVYDLYAPLKAGILEVVPEDARSSPTLFARALTSEKSLAVRSFLLCLLKDLVARRLSASFPNDLNLVSAVQSQTASWMIKTLEDLAKAKNVDLSAAPAQFASWIPDFEKARQMVEPAKSTSTGA